MKKIAAASLLLLMPALASAQNLAPLGNLIGSIGKIVGFLVPILITLALAVFFWGLVVYLWNQKHEEGRQIMIWGLITLFIMVSVWGIVRIAQDALGLDRNAQVYAPQVLVPGSPNSTGVDGYFGTTNYQNTNSFGGPR